jgi:hypothetical protein
MASPALTPEATKSYYNIPTNQRVWEWVVSGCGVCVVMGVVVGVGEWASECMGEEVIASKQSNVTTYPTLLVSMVVGVGEWANECMGEEITKVPLPPHGLPCSHSWSHQVILQHPKGMGVSREVGVVGVGVGEREKRWLQEIFEGSKQASILT